MASIQKNSETMKKNRLPGNFPDQLKRERERHGWSQKDLAGLLDTSQVNVSRWEKGHSLPGPYYRRALAELFRISVQELGLISEDIAKITEESDRVHLKTNVIWTMPHSFTSFIGREWEVTKVCTLLEKSDVRLVTLLGPPGVGKTRLSVCVAEKMHSYFEDGACFISLATISDPGLVIPTIARGLEIRENGTMPLAKLVIATLRDKRFLLLLDNLEQIVATEFFEEVLAPFLEELLEACSNLKIVITSRVVLYHQAEHIFQVHPLKLPDMKNLPGMERLSKIDAVMLFNQRAQASQSDFQMTDANAQSIAEICTLLDGLPLAIELASALIRLLSPQALLMRLKQLPHSLYQLKSGIGSLPRRQQTLYQTIKWSYDLLNEQEQWLFCHLSVFSGGCTVNAVEFLVTHSQMQRIDVLNTLSSLIDKSMLYKIEHNGEPRFMILETMKEYGLDCLRQQGEIEAYQMIHAEFYASFVIEAGPYLSGPKQIEWLLRLDYDLENLRTTLNWLIEHEKMEKTALQFVDAFGKFCGLRGYWTEELRWLQSVLKLSYSSEFQAIRARVLRRAGHLAYRQRNLKMARDCQEESVNLSRAMGDKQNLAGALSGLAWTRYRLDNSDSISSLLVESVIMARESEDKWALANALESQGRFLLIRGDTDKALSLVTESVELAREVDDKESLARILTTLVSVEMARGNLAHACDVADESFTIAQKLSTKPLMALILEHRGNITLFLGEYQQAADIFEERLTLAHELDDKPAVAKNQLLLGEIALVRSDFVRAHELARNAAAFFDKQEDNPNIALSSDILGSISLAQGMLIEASQYYRKALRLDKEGAKRNIGKHLAGLALVVLAQKKPEAAARLFGAASSRIDSEIDMHPAQRKIYNDAIKLLCAQLGESRFNEELHYGAAMKLEDIFEDTMLDIE